MMLKFIFRLWYISIIDWMRIFRWFVVKFFFSKEEKKLIYDSMSSAFFNSTDSKLVDNDKLFNLMADMYPPRKKNPHEKH